jgi:hypothetical protein
VLGTQHIDELGTPQAITRNTGPQQRLALRQQLRADEIACFPATGEVCDEFAELALDLELKPLPPRLRGPEGLTPALEGAPEQSAVEDAAGIEDIVPREVVGERIQQWFDARRA